MAQSPEQKKSYAVIKKFLGVNTKANRTAIQEDEFAWLENAMPVGYANLKTLPTYSNLGITFTQPVMAMFNVNIGLTDYLIAFETDGSAEYVNLQTLTKGTLAAAATFTAAPVTASASAGTFQEIHVPAPGYHQFYAGGTVTGTFAVGMTLIGNGIPANTKIISITGGGFYNVNQPVGNIGPIAVTGTTVSVTGTLACSQWQNQYLLIQDPIKGYFTWDGTNLINVGSLSGIGIVSGGSGYNTAPTITISAPNQTGGTQATAIATITNTAGQVINILVTSGGTGYTTVPQVTLDAPPAPGIKATAAAAISGGNVVGISIITTGSGYVSNPNVSITGGGGSGATATATIDRGSINSIILDRKSTRLNSSHIPLSRMPSSA